MSDLTLQERVEYYTGDITDTDFCNMGVTLDLSSNLTQWLNDAANDVVMWLYSKAPGSMDIVIRSSTSSSSTMSIMGMSQLVGVLMQYTSDGGWVIADKIPTRYSRYITDTDSRFYAKSTAPKFYVKSGKVYVYPTDAYYYEYQWVGGYSGILATSKSISEFSDMWLNLVVFYAAQRILEAKAAHVRTYLPGLESTDADFGAARTLVSTQEDFEKVKAHMEEMGQEVAVLQQHIQLFLKQAASMKEQYFAGLAQISDVRYGGSGSMATYNIF